MDTDDLLELLRTSTADCIGDADRVAVAYSGGVDSALIERLAREWAATVCYTCAVIGSHDHGRAPVHAAESGASLIMSSLDRDGLEELVTQACSVLGSSDPLRVAYTVPILCVVDEAREEIVLVGSGADELFGGYAKYLNAEDPENSMQNDIKKMQIENGLVHDYAKSKGKRIGAPFISSELVSYARTLPITRKLLRQERKVILREAARSVGVLSHDAPKKAAQYSSGVMKEMKRAAKEADMELREWTEHIAAKGRRIP